jgi:hypothetical protein
MAFVCIAQGDKTPVLDLNGNIALVVGYDDQEDKTYSTLTGFASSGGGCEEFFFCLVEFDHAYKAEHQFWLGSDVARFITREDRARVLETFLFGAQCSLEKGAPVSFFMAAHEPNLPEPAIRKYLLMGDVFKRNGYEVREEEPYLGRCSWWMELPQ